MKHRQHFIFDVDGTLIAPVENRPANTVDEIQLMPNVVEKLSQLRNGGHAISLASNQGGVAFGIITPKQAYAKMQHVAELVGAIRFEFCLHHPKGTVPEYAKECEMRKPNPGMLNKLVQQVGVPIENTFYIGDFKTDKLAANAAGVNFIWAWFFFGWPLPQEQQKL